MTFNWILDEQADEKLKKFCVELEYQLRPKIMRFLMSRLEKECGGDFSCFYFDVDLGSRCITLSPKTPTRYISLIEADFEMEINRNCC